MNILLNIWRDFQYGISNLIAYFPLIWRDRNWDYSYLLDLMEFKLRRMAESQTMHEGYRDYQQQMIIVAGLCKALTDEDSGAWMNEEEIARLLGGILGENVLYWWD